LTTNSLDLLLGLSAEKLGLDNDRLLGEVAVSEYLEDTGLCDIDHGYAGLLLGIVLSGLLGHKAPHLLDVDCGAEVGVSLQVEHSHTVLSKVIRVVFEEVDTVVVHTSSVTTTSRMLTVLTNTTVTSRDVSSLFSVLSEASGHD